MKPKISPTYHRKDLPRMSKLAISVLTATFAISLALDCSNVIFKEQQGPINYLARINFTVPVATGKNGWIITLFFDQTFTGVGVWEGFVTYDGTERWAQIQNRNESDAQLDAGDNKNLTFRLRYGMDIPIPQVVSTRFQDIELCQ